MDRQNTREFLLAQCARYPALRPEDLLKGLHQSTFGCGHLVKEPSAAADFIRREAECCKPANGPVIEPLDGGFFRVHLSGLVGSGLTAEEFAWLFSASAEIVCGSGEEMEERLAVLLELAENNELPFSHEETLTAVEEWRKRGYPACHHSEVFRAAYAPAYRVLWWDYVGRLPLNMWEKVL